MKALRWYGKNDVRVENVPDPELKSPKDAIIKITSTAICGSDLHLYDGYNPTMQKGDILGHEPMGEVVEVGSEVTNIKPGDKVVVPFVIACGECFFCQKEMYSLCDNTNPNAALAQAAMGHSPAGLFGYSHLTGGFSGGQAEYLRVPFANVGPFRVPDGIPDEKVLFLSDIFPTAVAIWGAGPVGLLAVKCAWMLGAGRVIMIDRVPERLEMAVKDGQAETINFEEVDVYDALMEMTGGRGPDRCMDAVGLEAHGGGTFDGTLDVVKTKTGLATDRPHVLRQAIMACRKGGTISVPGVYSGLVDHVPFGAFMNKGLTMKTGQTHVQKYLPLLFEKIENGEIDPSFVITHEMSLDDAPQGYEMFKHKHDSRR
jgi:threonine dehydrogenase-like Zn-dependent dehydrogenase